MGVPSLMSRIPRAAAEEPQQVKQLVSFKIGIEEFGVDILMVQEIIRLPAITPVPNAPKLIIGMINLRGRIIPVVDLRQRLHIRGAATGGDGRKARILIVEIFEHVTGFIVDSVSEVMKVPVNDIEPTPHLLASNIDSEYIRGVVKMGGRLVILLDFRKILRPQEERELEQMDMDLLEGKSEADTGKLDIAFNISYKDKD